MNRHNAKIQVQINPSALHPPARAFPCRFPATPSIFVGGADQAYEITGIFGRGGVPEIFFPDSSRMAGKRRAQLGSNRG
jgi:hypothetical protein